MSQQKNNIFAFIGQNIPHKDKTLQALVSQFWEKHGLHNILRTTGGEISNDIYQNIYSSGLFSEKKLFIFTLGTEKKSSKTNISEIWEPILSSWGNDHLLVFLLDTLDTKTPLHKFIDIYASKKIFNIPEPSELQDYIENNLPHATDATIKKLATLFPCYEQKYGKNVYIPHSLELLSQSLLQLNLYKPDEPILPEDLQLISHPSTLQNDTFEFLDIIFSQSSKKVLEYALSFFEKNGVSYGVSSLLWVMRKTLYAQSLLHANISSSEICDLLDAKPFFIQKASRQLWLFSQFYSLYSSLLQLQIKSRKGELKDEEIYLLFVQKTICSLGNS